MYRAVYTCVVILCSSLLQVYVCENPLLRTKLGLIRGLEAEDGDYFMYLGIPYARVNESNPFGESLPQPAFETVFEANDDTSMCPQREEFNNTIQGSLDCLKVNIYVPKSANSNNKLPILVYIYGGNYRLGFAGRYVYGQKYFMRHDIIVVNFNYRLGPYGFFCLNIPEAPGNQAFKDQKSALRWIYDNIEEFGGDKNKITLDGHSFGAVSVDLLLHSMDENEKWIDKAIIQSCNNFDAFPFLNMAENNGVLQVADFLGFNTNNVSDALKFLANVNSSLVIKASLDLNIQYGFCVEKTFHTIDKFLPDYRWNLKVPAAKGVSFMVGNTGSEALFGTGLKLPEFFKDLDPITLMFKHFNMTNNEMKEASKIIHDFYQVNETFCMRMKDKFIQFESDFYYLHASRQNILKYKENGAKEVYYYIFRYSGERNFMKQRVRLASEEGATHGDEIGYFYDVSYMKEPSRDDKLIIDRMTTMWANFVKYGNPTPVTTKLLPVKWKPYTNDNQYYLEIDKTVTLKSTPESKAMAFWDLFNKVYGSKAKSYLWD